MNDMRWACAFFSRNARNPTVSKPSAERGPPWVEALNSYQLAAWLGLHQETWAHRMCAIMDIDRSPDMRRMHAMSIVRPATMCPTATIPKVRVV